MQRGPAVLPHHRPGPGPAPDDPGLAVFVRRRAGERPYIRLLDAVRLGPEDDVAEVTALQVRRVVEDLIAGGRWRECGLDILIVFDAGYDAPRMAYLLDGLPVEVLGRMRSDRVMRRPMPSLKEYAEAYPRGGWFPKHGKEFRFAKPETWGEPDAATVQITDRYGTARAMAWDRLHPRLTTRSAWIDHDGELSIIEGTLIRLEVDRLPGGGDPLPLWLWSSAVGMTGADVDLRWQAFLRRFDLEHTFRMIKQTLGWTRAKLRTPAAADRWTWLIMVAHTQLRLGRPLAEDVRRPWEPPMKPNKLNPVRVRRGFRNLRPALPCPARAPKPSRPGPGRPLGSKNHQRDTRHDVGKIVRRPETIIDGTGSDHKEQLRTSASAPTVRGEIKLARESTQGPAEQGFLQAEPTSAPDAPAFVLSVLFLRAAPLFLPGRLLLLHGFFQGLHQVPADPHPRGIVVGTDRFGVHADQRQVRPAHPGALGDQAFQQGREHTGVPPHAEAPVNDGPRTEPGRYLPPLPTGTKPPDHTLELLPQPLRTRPVPTDRQIRLDELPLGMNEFPTHHNPRPTGPHPSNRPEPATDHDTTHRP